MWHKKEAGFLKKKEKQIKKRAMEPNLSSSIGDVSISCCMTKSQAALALAEMKLGELEKQVGWQQAQLLDLLQVVKGLVQGAAEAVEEEGENTAGSGLEASQPMEQG
jgi:hypothetical protein